MSAKFLCLIGLLMMTSSTPSTAETQKLPLCPNSPNCVSSQAAQNDSHFIAPFKIIADMDHAWAAVKQTLITQPRTVITQESTDNLDAEATSLIFRFVDDVKIILDRDHKLIHIRSASRVGYGDFGVNRKRVEQLRSDLQQQNIIE